MANHDAISPSSRQLEVPKFIAPGDPDNDAPEPVSPQVIPATATLQPSKPESSPRQHALPEAGSQERSCMRRKTMCGLTPAVFILLVTLAMIIVAAAVGGSVGGSVAVKNARLYVIVREPRTHSLLKHAHREGVAEGRSSCSTTETTISSPAPSSTPSDSPFVPPTNRNLTLNCPDLTGDVTVSELDSNHTYTFKSECGFDRVVGAGQNIVAPITYSFEHCLRACGTYNRNDRDDRCVAVTFMADMPWTIDQYGGNCYLKSERGRKEPFEPWRRNFTVSALLQEDE